MNTSSPSPLLKAFSNRLPLQFKPESYEDSFYVNRLEGNDRRNPIRKLRQAIATRDGSGAYLFSGHRGAGKTTELNRMVEELRADGSIALYCDASDIINTNDPVLGLSDILFTLCAGLGEAALRYPGFEGQSPLRESWNARLWRLLNSEVEIDPTLKAELGVEGAKLALETSFKLKDNPAFQQKLRTYVERTNGLLNEAKAFIAEVCKQLRQGDEARRVVLVIDSLERLSAPTGEELKLFNSLREVFDHNAQRLHFADMSVVYSVPPYLEAVLRNVANNYHGLFYLPHFKVMERSAAGATPAPHALGQLMMREVVERRFPDWEQVISSAVMDRFAYLSGGNLRVFFRLIRNLLLDLDIEQPALPLTEADHAYVQDVISEAANPYRYLTQSERDWLKRILTSSDCVMRDDDDPATLMRLFDQSLVLDYQNGERWYQVMPLMHARL